tara:strand:+ start:358 stop:606 length:249 start_codon:yes stop_codon:yes gene_type:complete
MATENQTQPQELNQSQALNVLIQAVRIAQGKGAFTLEDAELVAKAIKVFVPQAPVGEEGGEDPVINKDETPEPTEPVVEKVD